MGEYTETELAYVAGFFDGEGCVRISKARSPKGMSYNYSVSVTIGNTDLDVLRYIQGMLGGSLYKGYPTVNKEVRTLHWNGKRACRILELLLPYLRAKRKQAEVCIHFQNEIGLKGRKATQVDKELQEIFYNMCKGLKHQS